MAVGEPAGLGEAEVYAMIDSLGNVSAVLADGQPGRLAQLLARLR
ncbi:hypothetical protein ACWEHA_01005 [Amycolatopsis nivea]